MQALVKVDFHGDTLFAEAQADGPPIVAVKPIIDRLGLDWNGQYQRMKRDELLAEGMCVITIPSPGGPQDSVGLPLNLIPGFLFGISAERIADPTARQMVVAYKRECHEVLFRHFYGKAEAPDPSADWDWDEINRKLHAVQAARLAHGRKAAVALWAALDLPMPWLEAEARPRREDATQGLDFVKAFLDERVADAPGGRVMTADLYKAYTAWADETKSPSMTSGGFAKTMAMTGRQKMKSNGLSYYVGLRIKHRLELAEE
jgi:hypothetical protein